MPRQSNTWSPGGGALTAACPPPSVKEKVIRIPDVFRSLTYSRSWPTRVSIALVVVVVVVGAALAAITRSLAFFCLYFE